MKRDIQVLRQSSGPQKIAALRTLSDEIYPLLRDARTAKFIVGDLFEGYFGDDEPDGFTHCAERLMCGYGRAQLQMQILLDYTSALVAALEYLDGIASEEDVVSDVNPNSCIVSSKKLLRAMQLLSDSGGLYPEAAEAEAAALFADLPSEKQAAVLKSVKELVASERDKAWL